MTRLRRFRSLVAAAVLLLGGALPISAASQGVYRGVQPVVKFDVSPPLRSIAPRAVEKGAGLLMVDPESDLKGPLGPQDSDASVLQDWVSPLAIPAPTVSFDGFSNPLGYTPPDPNGDVGPSHVVIMANVHFAIYDKTGAVLYGPAANNTLWAGFGGACETENAGDPVVLYDQWDDRWLLTQFTANGPTYYNCVALSTSSDPTGSYYRWAFSTGANFPDYPKYGIWGDGVYISTREFAGAAFAGVGAYAINRAQMVAGNPSPTMISFLAPPVPAYNVGDGLLPADVDGFVQAANPADEIFVGSMDNGGNYGAPQDALTVWRFHTDFVTPALSTFGVIATVPISAYDTMPAFCSGRSCVPQPGTAIKVDHLGYRQRPLHRAAYRNFGTHESIVTNQAVEASATMSGIRWWELRNPNGTPTLYQEGTYAPGTTDSIHRWMGSAAQDQAGNLALAYSASAASGTFPSVWYTGRLVGDPLGTLPQGEGSVVDGTGSQTSSGNRWGDYTSITVDPVDDCTFWIVNEWYPTTSAAGWRMRVGAFRFDACGTPDFYLGASPASQSICAGSDAVYTINVGALAGFTNPVTLGGAGQPAGTTVGFVPITVPPPGTSTMTIGNTGGVGAGTYSVSVNGTATGSPGHSTSVDMTVYAASPAAANLVSPANGAGGVSLSPTLTWDPVADAIDYLVEVDDNSDFSSPVYSATVTGTSANASGLAVSTLYYWRVTANNPCGATVSTVFTFSTGVVYCSSPSLAIPDNTPAGANDTLTIADTGTLIDLNVSVVATHTWVGDVRFTLSHNGGTAVAFFNRPGVPATTYGCAGDNIDVLADDEGPDTAIENQCGNLPAISGDAPGGDPPSTTLLTAFDTQEITGTWTINAADFVGGDTGTLATWCLYPVFGTPGIAVNPTAIANTQAANSTATLPLDVQNTGDGALHWSIAEEPVAAPAPKTALAARPMPPVRRGGDATPADFVRAAESEVPAPTTPAATSQWRVPASLLYDNGPLVTHPGGGFGGADASATQTGIGLTVNGFNVSQSGNFRVADDFTIPGPASWTINTITVFAYQTGSTTTSTITGVNLQIWDGPPDQPGSMVVFGDTTTNRLAATQFSNIYRAADTNLLANNRPEMAVTATVGTVLAPGTYWLDWQTSGSLASGPWVSPVTLLGQLGKPGANAMQSNAGTWAALADGVNPQDLPFLIDGTAPCAAPADVPWLSLSATSGTTAPGGTTTVDVTLDSTGMAPGLYQARLCLDSDDPAAAMVIVPVDLTVDTMPFLDGFESGDTSQWSAAVP